MPTCAPCQLQALGRFAGVREDEARAFLENIAYVAVRGLEARQYAASWKAAGKEVPAELKTAIVRLKEELMVLVRIACGTERPTDLQFILPISVWGSSADVGATEATTSFWTGETTVTRKAPCVRIVPDAEFLSYVAGREPTSPFEGLGRQVSGFRGGRGAWSFDGLSSAVTRAVTGIEDSGSLGALGLLPLLGIVLITSIALAYIADQISQADILRAQAARTYADSTAEIMLAVASGDLDPKAAQDLINAASAQADAAGLAQPGFWASLGGKIGTGIIILVGVAAVGTAAYFIVPKLLASRVARAAGVAGLSVRQLRFEFED